MNPRCPGPNRPNFIADQLGTYCQYCGHPFQRPRQGGQVQQASLQEAVLALELVIATAANEVMHRQGALKVRTRALLIQLAQETQQALDREGRSPHAGTARELLEVAAGLSAGRIASPTLSVLATRFVSRDFEDKGPVVKGAHKRFLKPTPPPQPNANGPTRKISQEQAASYKRLRDQVIRNELSHGSRYYCFYHAQDPRMRIAQDLYKKVYEKYHQTRVPKDFHFFRFPGPQEDTFAAYANATDFLVDKIHETGMIDDNDGGTKLHIISANLSLFGSLGHSGEETFHYFQIGKGQTPLDPTGFIKGFFDKFGYDANFVTTLMAAAELIDTSEGSLFQILVPHNLVDDVAYMAHPHGIPFDDELLDDLHSIGDIKYRWEPFTEGEDENVHEGRRLAREKMNDELTRKLKLFPQRPPAQVGPPRPLRSALKNPNNPRPPSTETVEERTRRQDDDMSRRYRKELDALTERTVERARAGQYKPSAFLATYSTRAERFRDRDLERHQEHLRRAPDHVGHGKKSPHELMRIQNRPLFMQARVLLARGHMLNPQSGIKIFRHTTVAPERMARYEHLLEQMVETFIRPKPLLMLTYR